MKSQQIPDDWIPPQARLPDSVAEIEAGKPARQAEPLNHSEAGRRARLAGIRAASDLQEPPKRSIANWMSGLCQKTENGELAQTEDSDEKAESPFKLTEAEIAAASDLCELPVRQLELFSYRSWELEGQCR